MLLIGCLFKNLALVCGKYVFQILIAIVVSHIKQRQKFSLIQKRKKAEFTKATEEHPDVL